MYGLCGVGTKIEWFVWGGSTEYVRTIFDWSLLLDLMKKKIDKGQDKTKNTMVYSRL